MPGPLQPKGALAAEATSAPHKTASESAGTCCTEGMITGAPNPTIMWSGTTGKNRNAPWALLGEHVWFRDFGDSLKPMLFFFRISIGVWRIRPRPAPVARIWG